MKDSVFLMIAFTLSTATAVVALGFILSAEVAYPRDPIIADPITYNSKIDTKVTENSNLFEKDQPAQVEQIFDLSDNAVVALLKESGLRLTQNMLIFVVIKENATTGYSWVVDTEALRGLIEVKSEFTEP